MRGVIWSSGGAWFCSMSWGRISRLVGSDWRAGRAGRVQKLERERDEAKALAESIGDTEKAMEAAEADAKRLRKAIADMAEAGKAPEADAAPAGPNILDRIVGSVPDLLRKARAIPGQVWEALQKAAADYRNRNAELFHELKVLDAQQIRDDLQRELALTRLAYDRKIRMAKEAGQEIALVEQAREKQLALIRREYAERSAQDKADREKALDREIERFAAEALKDGAERRIALLKVEERERIAAAKAAGMGDAHIAKLKQFYMAQRMALSFEGLDPAKVKETVDRAVGVKGTFNAAEARGLGAGGATDRIASAVEKTEKNTKVLADASRRGGLVFA